ncbi:MAG: bifunctional 3-deoxy-7-phosphoheptulonate synthase/chorismate mutase type II [Cyclobacteriaceae bacterium]
MSATFDIAPIESWVDNFQKPLIISGPCSAETEEQLLETCTQLKNIGINIMRAGVWKPRTRPNNFEGIGTEALAWIAAVKKELGVKFSIEVANPQHVEQALKYGIDVLWIGARSTVNPFTVQEIADSLKGVDVPVLVKNPINPDLALWMGALERINGAGITKLGAIHRGFSSQQESKYRNLPLWRLAIDLKSEIPELPIICDPSHICGNREMLAEVSQKALDLNYDGIMIESHRDPDNAWSDAKQQITPETLKGLLNGLKLRSKDSTNESFKIFLEEMREQIDESDRDILEAISRRMNLVEKIGEFKQDNNVTIFQVDRWNEIYRTRGEWAQGMGLDKEFIEEMYKLIHIASIKQQTELLSKTTAKA